MSLTPTRPRPEGPTRADLDAAGSWDERARLLTEFNHDLASWWFESAGYEIVPEGEEWELDVTKYGCAECVAAWNGEKLLARGKDSHGDCADDGEKIYWVRPIAS